MINVFKTYVRIFVLVFGIILGLSFGGDGEQEASDAFAWVEESDPGEILPGVNPRNVSGDIVIAGSSTVFPLLEQLATRFREEGYGYNLSIDSIGSGAGFERFCVSAETDISMASRPIKDVEREAAIENNRTPIEFLIGTDALAVVTHPDNTWIQEADIELLALLFTAESWNDVNPSWPDEPIMKFIPGTDSGTFDFFVEEIFDKNLKLLLNSPNLQLSEDDNILVRGVAGNTNAIGFFGYAYYQENRDRVSILAIDGVIPSSKTVANTEYPLARPLLLYSAGSIMKEKPQVAAFLNFMLTYVQEEIQDVGYFPAGQQNIELSKEVWLESMKGLY